jgi:hypothetical protein
MIQVKEDNMARACSTHGEKLNAYSVLVGKPEGKSPLINLEIYGTIIVKWISE